MDTGDLKLYLKQPHARYYSTVSMVSIPCRIRFVTMFYASKTLEKFRSDGIVSSKYVMVIVKPYHFNAVRSNDDFTVLTNCVHWCIEYLCWFWNNIPLHYDYC